MSTKAFVFIFVSIGSIAGGYIPALWGDSLFSFASIFFSGVGGILGIWIGLQVGDLLNS